jgi:hypothetical protein
LPRACLTRFVPPSGFAYPLDGFLPSIPCRFCFTPAALLGFALRRLPLSQGFRSVSTPSCPTYRFSRRSSRCRSIRPARRAAVPGSLFPCRESLVPARGFNPSRTGSSLGLSLLGYPGDSLDRAFTRSPLTRFTNLGHECPCPPAPQSLTRPSPRLCHAPHVVRGTAKPTLLGFLHLPDPAHSSTRSPWLWVHRTLRPASLPTSNVPRAILHALPELLGIDFGAELSRPEVQPVPPFRVFGIAS